MILKPQDILVLLKLISMGPKTWSYHELATSLGMSPSEVHAAIRRSVAAQLAIETKNNIYPNISNLEEFLIHGLKYAFVPDRGELTRGFPTRYAAPPLLNSISSEEYPPVWPDPEGNTRGSSFSPLYNSAPKAALMDKSLYALLVIIDALRGGSAREKELAVKRIKETLKRYGKQQQATKSSNY
ncbi:MAG TPA: hypothetical protein VFX30_06255 [bacterium]|nr:hypothetical protein [bacterium]